MLWLGMTSKTRKKLPDEGRTVSEFDPGPLIVMFLSITSSPLVKLMVPFTPKLIVSPSFASASAWRNEPGPLSFRLVTVMMLAGARRAIRCASANGIRQTPINKTRQNALRLRRFFNPPANAVLLSLIVEPPRERDFCLDRKKMSRLFTDC